MRDPIKEYFRMARRRIVLAAVVVFLVVELFLLVVGTSLLPLVTGRPVTTESLLELGGLLTPLASAATLLVAGLQLNRVIYEMWFVLLVRILGAAGKRIPGADVWSRLGDVFKRPSDWPRG